MAIAPWSVKGIDMETREAAKAAARTAGLTLGAWLNRTIRDAADGRRRPDAAPVNGLASAPPAVERGDLGPTAQAMFDTIQKISARLEELEDRLLQAPPTLAERMDRLSANVEAISARADAANEPLERAIARLSERVQRLELGGLRPAEPAPRKRFGIGRAR